MVLPALDTAQAAFVDDLLAQHAALPGPLIEILHAIQDELGCVPSAAVPVIANALNLSRAEVHGVVSFYQHFREQPPGRHVWQLCRAEACQAMGAATLAAHVKRCLGIDFHMSTADGRHSLEAAYCFGNCACAPALMLDGALHGGVTPQRFDELLAGDGAAR